MDLFSALADHNRRRIIEILASRGQLSASQISGKFNVSPPAISQHLKVLREAKLVKVAKKAQMRLYRINPDSMSKLEGWAHKMKKVWNYRFDRMDQLLKSGEKKGGVKWLKILK